MKEKIKVLSYNPILVYFFLLMGVSLLTIASTLAFAQQQYGPQNFVLRQGIFFGVGFVALVAILAIGINRIRVLRWWIYGIIMVALLVLFIQKKVGIFPDTFIPNTNGATRWFKFPGVGTIQPSEFMRIALILVIGDIIEKHNQIYLHLRRTPKSDFQLIMKIIAVMIPPAFLIFSQPDSGITILILFTAALMILASGIQWRYILSVGAVAAVVVTAFIIVARDYPEFITGTLGVDPYKLSRFTGWFDPFGTISGEGYQLAQSIVAVGSGGLFGNGFRSLGAYVAESHTDFIFSVIGKDFGLIGSLFVLVLYGLFNFEILNIAVLNRGKYNGFVCAGIFGSLIGQIFWNIGMCTGLIPISGVTLPFLSHGGSSVLASMIMLGLALSSYIEGIKFKTRPEIKEQENILYLKTKPYLKQEPKLIKMKKD